MADMTLAKLNVLLGAEHTELDRALKEVQDRVEKTGKKLSAMGRGLTRNVTAPLLAIGAAGFKVSGDFEQSLAKMEGLVGIQREQIDDWRGDIRRLAVDYGSSATEAADAMFFITSAGLRGSDALDTLEASLKASASGLGDVTVVADLATSAMNAYGADVLSAAGATDVLTAAVREGKLEPAELASSMGRVLPVASNMGIRFDEVGAAMAAMSRTGTNASTAADQLRQIMVAILKPTADAETALEEMGLSAGGLRTQIREQGLLAALDTLSTAFEGNAEAQARVFGDVGALAGVMDLMGASAETTAEIFGALADSAGATDEAFSKQITSMFKLDQAWASLKNLALEIGNAVSGPMTTAIGAVTGAVRGLTSVLGALPTPVTTVAVGLAGLAAAAGPVLVALGSIMTLTPTLVAGYAALTAASGSLVAIMTTQFTVKGLVAGATARLTAVTAGLSAANITLASTTAAVTTALTALRAVALTVLAPLALVGGTGLLLAKNWDVMRVQGALAWAALKIAVFDAVDAILAVMERLLDAMPFVGDRMAASLAAARESLDAFATGSLAKSAAKIVEFERAIASAGAEIDELGGQVPELEGALANLRTALDDVGVGEADTAFGGLNETLGGTRSAVDGLGEAARTNMPALDELAGWADEFRPVVGGGTGFEIPTGDLGEGIIRATDAVSDAIDPMREIGDVLEQSMNRGLRSIQVFSARSGNAFQRWAATVMNEISRVIARMLLLKALSAVVPGGSFLATALSLPARATGGPVRGREPVLVGERGPEVFVPSGTGEIVANQHLRGAGPGAGEVAEALLSRLGPPPNMSPEVAATADWHRRLFGLLVLDARERGVDV